MHPAVRDLLTVTAVIVQARVHLERVAPELMALSSADNNLDYAASRTLAVVLTLLTPDAPATVHDMAAHPLYERLVGLVNRQVQHGLDRWEGISILAAEATQHLAGVDTDGLLQLMQEEATHAADR